MYILDTDSCIYWLKGLDKVKENFIKHKNKGIGISVITLAELKYGAYKSQKIKQNLSAINNFIYGLRIFSIDDALDKYAQIKVELESKGNALDEFDLLIAATALVNNAALVTNNIKHFKRIKDLSVTNWI